MALNELASEAGGFNHNTHSLRVVEFLEHPFPAHRGLNLTEATRAGLATHETRYDSPSEGQPNEATGSTVAVISGGVVSPAAGASTSRVEL